LVASAVNLVAIVVAWMLFMGIREVSLTGFLLFYYSNLSFFLEITSKGSANKNFFDGRVHFCDYFDGFSGHYITNYCVHCFAFAFDYQRFLSLSRH
jgi:hypothetical protein